jgi:hypothetical protein
MDDPTRHLLVPVAPPERVADGFANVTQVLDYVSPTAWLNAAIQGMTGYDVLETLVQPISGDWERIGRYGDALGHMSACLGELAIQVQTHANDLSRHWTGNAGDAAFVYFSDTATALSRHAAVLQIADERYTALALDVWHMSQQLQGLLQSICDQAAVALIEMAAGTALIETGIGAVAGYSLAAIQIASIVRTIARASLIIQAAGAAIGVSVAGLTGVLKEFGDLGSIPMPARAYQNPVGAR